MSQSKASRTVVVNGPWAARSRASSLAPEPSDSELVRLLVDDAPAAAGVLHDRYAPTVNRLVWRLLGADAEHDDIVQQVFCKVIEHAGELRDPSRLTAWIQKTTINTVYAELRRRAVRRLFLRERTEIEFHPDLTRDSEIRDFLLCAQNLIRRLRDRDRVVFVLHFVEGRTLADIADLCGCSLRTAKRRLSVVNLRLSKLTIEHPEFSRLFGNHTEEA
jgi:RNA polymerase sigma-70 factor, ECF subfamily